MMQLPQFVKIVEVGPRDGLQNEPQRIDTDIKVEFINRLSLTGLSSIEATSMVSPKWIPQLADSEEVYRSIQRHENITYPVLVPNLQGLERALRVGAQEIAVFTAASQTFSQKNTHCSIEDSLKRIESVVEMCQQHNIRIRAYLSCVLGCPYEGQIKLRDVSRLVNQLYEMGCTEISLGDTIGMGTPLQAQTLINEASQSVPLDRLAVHFHDTRGQALANIFACLQQGITIVDCSVAGLGGCPYANGATGNVATEDVVYMLHGMGIKTGIDLEKLLSVGRYISQQLGRVNQSKLGRLGDE